MKSLVHLLAVLLLVIQASGDQGDDYQQADNYNDGYYNQNGNGDGDGQNYNDGYNANDQNYTDYNQDYNQDGYVANYNNGYDVYEVDGDGDGMGGAWINGVYSEFCDDNDGNQGDNECIDYNKYIPSENCEQGIITVKSISISCDSPYQSYYGNGAHKNSQLCDYGDKATITVFFKNAYNLPQNKDIFMTLGVYARKTNLELVYAARNVELCQTMVGHECTAAGNYAFSFRATFDWVYGDRSTFVPVVEMGFSTKADEGYDLGGVNINCEFDGNYRPYDPWLDKSTTWGAGAGFAANYGLLIGVLLLLFAFGMYAYKQYGSDIEWSSFGQKKPLEEDLMISQSGSVAEA
jgi:hypothetical protein